MTKFNRHRSLQSDMKIRDALRAAYEQVPIPEFHNGWEAVQHQLQSMRRRSNRNRRVAMAILLCVVSAFFAIPIGLGKTEGLPMSPYLSVLRQSAYAAERSPIMNRSSFSDRSADAESNSSIEEMPKARIMAYTYGTDHPLPKAITLYEADKVLSFQLHLPTDVPEGYGIQSVTSTKSAKAGKSDQVRILYAETGRDPIIYEVQALPSDAASIRDMRSGGLEINLVFQDRDAVLIAYATGGLSLIWDDGGLRYKLNGHLKKDELLHIAGSIR